MLTLLGTRRNPGISVEDQAAAPGSRLWLHPQNVWSFREWNSRRKTCVSHPLLLSLSNKSIFNNKRQHITESFEMCHCLNFMASWFHRGDIINSYHENVTLLTLLRLQIISACIRNHLAKFKIEYACFGSHEWQNLSWSFRPPDGGVILKSSLENRVINRTENPHLHFADMKHMLCLF